MDPTLQLCDNIEYGQCYILINNIKQECTKIMFNNLLYHYYLSINKTYTIENAKLRNRNLQKS